MNKGERAIKRAAALMLVFALLSTCGCQTIEPAGSTAATAAPTTEPATEPATQPTVEPTTEPTMPATEPETEPATQPTQPYVPEGELSFYDFHGSYDFTFTTKGKLFPVYNGTIPVEYVNFYSADEGVAVIKDGVVEMIGGGVTKVYAECNGKMISCIIRCAFTPMAVPKPMPIPEPTEPTEPETEPTEPTTPEEKWAEESLAYGERIAEMTIFDNMVSQALPQTVVHKLVMEHFNAPLAEGTTVKKAIVIGYDGFRTDGLDVVKDMWNSGIMRLKHLGGLYHTFAGGVLGSNEQLTSSGPGWTSILTGGWDDYHGVILPEEPKNNVKSFLTELAQRSIHGSFTVSWDAHTDIIFRPDIEYAQANSLPLEYTLQGSDWDTYEKVLGYVAKGPDQEKTAQEDPDLIFMTFEFADSAGHIHDYSIDVPEYEEACREADKLGYVIVKSIEARCTYDQEDWLIIITTDHGGLDHEHWRQTTMERMTWLACNKMISLADPYLHYAQEPEHPPAEES